MNPVNLVWAMSASKDEFRTINPGRKVYCNLGMIDKRDGRLFILTVNPRPFNQNTFFEKGKYKFGVAVYCENSRTGDVARKEFVVDWSGKWFDEEKLMFEQGLAIRTAN